MRRRQQIAIGVANELRVFTKEQFQKYFRQIEGPDVSWPMGCVHGDVESYLNFLKESQVIHENGGGTYVCLIQGGKNVI